MVDQTTTTFQKTQQLLRSWNPNKRFKAPKPGFLLQCSRSKQPWETSGGSVSAILLVILTALLCQWQALASQSYLLRCSSAALGADLGQQPGFTALLSYCTAQISLVSQFSLLQTPISRPTLFSFFLLFLDTSIFFSALHSHCFISFSLPTCQKKQRWILLHDSPPQAGKDFATIFLSTLCHSVGPRWHHC